MPDRRVHKFTFLAAGTISGQGTTSPRTVSAFRELEFYFKATSAGSTFDAKLQTSPTDENGDWYDRASIAQMTASGNQSARLSDNIGKYFRVSYNAVGPWTMEITAIAKT